MMVRILSPFFVCMITLFCISYGNPIGIGYNASPTSNVLSSNTFSILSNAVVIL